MGDRLAPVIQLSSIDTETLRQAKELVRLAEAGELTGMAFVATKRGAFYIAGISGRCRSLPTLAMGMVCKLQNDLAALQEELMR